LQLRDNQKWRAEYGYNKAFSKILGDIKLKSWAEEPKFPSRDTIEQDFEELKQMFDCSKFKVVEKNILNLNCEGWL